MPTTHDTQAPTDLSKQLLEAAEACEVRDQDSFPYPYEQWTEQFLVTKEELKMC